MHLSRHQQVKRLTFSAMCVAASVVLCRLYISPSATTGLRFEVGFLPILIVAHLYGPLYGGMAYMLSDLIGAVLTTGINPFITLCKTAVGVLMGIFFYRHKLTFLRSLIAFSVIAVFVEFLSMVLVFRYSFGHPWLTAFYQRALTAFVMLPVRVLFACLLGDLLNERRGKIFYE
ncbi:MAG: folate family ECF transporter S component [Clostridia bacterium]|nr:folate family ECF transporter S component [Clostridia bacterium]